jgi:hypothetical protein
MAKNTRTYWYDYIDIDSLLNTNSRGLLYYVGGPASQNVEQALQRVSEAFEALELNPQLMSAVVPINLGHVKKGIYQGSHWTGLVLRRPEPDNSEIIQAFYNDSLGTSMDKSVPKLRQILLNHDVQEVDIFDLKVTQQYNGYDCGAWTVLNLDSLAKTGKLPNANENDIINQRSVAFGYVHIKDGFDNDIDVPDKSTELTDSINKLKIGHPPKFVVNPIIYVDGEESDESSDLSYDSSDEEIFDALAEPISKNNLPFKAFKVTKSKAKKTQGEEKFSKPVGFLSEKPNDLKVNYIKTEEPTSTIAQGFLDNLHKTGIMAGSQEKIEEVVSVSMLLNRPLSISTRKNHLLTKELDSTTKSGITHLKIGIFWEFTWYGPNNKKVSYSEVKTFYKKLKRYDENKGTSKAEQFKNIAEKGIAVPYQDLRELAKNHINTKMLIKVAREANPNSDIYMSFVDGDTKSFNGIYSAYVKIYHKSKTSPTVMSTGYEFQQEKAGDHPIVEGCKLDRQIRAATAKHSPWSVYYPEPNFCVLIMPEKDSVTESFIDNSIKAKGVIIKNAESVALIRHILSVRGKAAVSAVFVDEAPLITTIPPRVRLTKVGKKPIKFSEEFKAGLRPNDKDVTLFKQMSQSHVHEGVWIDNLSINRGIALKAGKHFNFKGLVTKYLQSTHTPEELLELKAIISGADLNLTKLAFEEKEEAIKRYKAKNLRTLDMEELFSYIKVTLEDEVDRFKNDFLEIIINAGILELLQKKLLDLYELSELSIDTLRTLLYNDEVLELIITGEVNWKTILNAYLDYFENTDEAFDEVDLPKFIELFVGEEDSLQSLFFEAKLTLLEIMNLYYEDYEVFSALAKEDAIKFVKEYSSEIEVDEIIGIYHDNRGLFDGMITDPEGIISDMGLQDFIEQFKGKQAARNNILSDEEEFDGGDDYPDEFEDDIYSSIHAEIVQDGCPDELLGLGSDSEPNSEFD